MRETNDNVGEARQDLPPSEHTPKTHRRKLLLIVAVIIITAICISAWHSYAQYRKITFLRGLHLVTFSTHMIGYPFPKTERAVRREAKQLNIDLFAAYMDRLDSDSRFSLAWMLISDQSQEYLVYTMRNVSSVPWPEVRVWRMRYRDESLSSEYRAKLFDLLMTSPTSEAKLAIAHWYEDQGRNKEAEDAYYAAMMQRERFHDALDAANELIESDRYRYAAAHHLLATVEDSEPFYAWEAIRLIELYGDNEELRALVASCDKEAKGGPNRRALVQALGRLIEEQHKAHEPDLNTNPS